MCLWEVTEVGERPERVYKVVDAKGAFRRLGAAAIVSSSNFGSVLAEGVERGERVVVLDWVVWEEALDTPGDR